jgi:hypothetical protein
MIGAMKTHQRGAYYRELQAEAERVCTTTEAGQPALTTGHYGPWPEEPSC